MKRGWAVLLAGLLLVMGVGWALNASLFSTQDRVWQRMQAERVWRVGMDPSFPPFESLNEAGEPVGFDVDLALALGQAWGVEVQFVAIAFDGLLDAVMVERVDAVISALPYDPRLTQDIRYSVSYFDAGHRILVPHGSPLRHPEDLGGRRVAVEWGSAGDAHARRLQQQMAEAQRADLERLPFDTPQAALTALTQGQADALILDGVSLRLAQGQGLPLLPLGDPLESDPYVIALPLRASQLQSEINQLISQFQADGTLARLEERWFGPLPAPLQSLPEP